VEAVSAILILAVLAVALFVLSQPFWPGHEERASDRDALVRADLEAAKVAKYREIHDASLDHRTGKLSDEDWRPIDRRLRAEAVEILDALERLGGPGVTDTRPDPADARL
jgi:hypothetical protein